MGSSDGTAQAQIETLKRDYSEIYRTSDPTNADPVLAVPGVGYGIKGLR